MPRPTNKADLLAAAESEFNRLWNAVDLVGDEHREVSGACDDWSVKDLLAHLHAWHEMAIGWEKAGVVGGTPTIPAEGYTFAETPALNQAIYERTKDDLWADVVDRLNNSHNRILAIINTYDDKDLFAKAKYPWTKSTSVGAYFVSASSSHYAWASKLTRKWAKQTGPSIG